MTDDELLRFIYDSDDQILAGLAEIRTSIRENTERLHRIIQRLEECLALIKESREPPP